MSERPKTHQERAERAARGIRPSSAKGTIGAAFDEVMVEVVAPIIAREMFPDELLAEARKRASECPECQGDGEVGKSDDFGNPVGIPCDHCADIRAALALYEDKP